MKKFYLFFLAGGLMLTNLAHARDVRSNHSYRNMGFTQLPTVSIGGYIDVNGAMAGQDAVYEDTVLDNVSTYDSTGALTSVSGVKNRATDDLVFSGEASLLFKVNGINDYGFKYGAVMELNANSTYNSWNDDLNATKAYMYGEGLFGKVEFGSDLGTSQKMKVDAGTFARATGGITGKYLNYINLPSILSGTTNTRTPAFILIPEHPTGHGGYAMGYNNLLYYCDYNGNGTIDAGDEYSCYSSGSNDNYHLLLQEMQNAVKISYYTPEIYGFQAGVSYTPDTGNKGVAGRLSSKLDTGDIDEVIEYGASYNGTFYGLSISLAFTGQQGKSESKALVNGAYETFREDLKSYQYGGSLTFFGLTVGGSYGDWGTSLFNKNTDLGKGDGKYYTLGVAYEFEGFSGSATYFESKFQDNKYIAYSFGIDYKVAKGFLPYIEYTHFEFTPNDGGIKKNEGEVVLAGFILNF